MDDSGLRLRSIRMKPGVTIDSLTNAITGLGTEMDPRRFNQYYSRTLTQAQIGAAYRGSGLMRKIIGIPALDMVREWRDWKADDEEITAIEAEEKRHMVRQKVQQVEVLRGLGGGAFILGLPGDPRMPAPETVAKGGLAFVHLVSRWQLQFDAVQDDSREPGYGEPIMYRMETTVGQIDLHPSRVIPFRGDPIPPVLGVPNFIEDFWGDSRVAAVLDAVQDCDTARGSFAHLITKASRTRIGIPNLLDTVSTSEGEGAFQRRMRVFALAESIFNATIFDTGDGIVKEEVTDSAYSFAGVKDVMNAYGEWASAISDIPATRLLGRAPEGMNSSGDSQQKDWNKLVRARQTLDLAPCLDRLDQYLIPSALGSRPPEVWYDFAPLDTPTEKERAETFKVQIEAIAGLQNTGTIPDEAFAKGVQSLMIDEGYLPGLEQALAEIPDDERYGIQADPDAETDNGGKEVDPTSAGGGTQEPARRAANDFHAPTKDDIRALFDATPRTLYVSRKVQNVADLKAWAKAQGLPDLQDDLHVTIAYSTTPVDWIEMGATWADFGNNGKGELVITAGGPRVVEPLGDRTAVLMFASSDLSWRNREMREKGASWDWPDYSPHISLTAEPVDLSEVEPYRGKIVLGPEIFEEIRSDDTDEEA